MDILGILYYIISVQVPTLVNTFWIWLINGKSASDEYRRKCFTDTMVLFNQEFAVKIKPFKTKLFEELSKLTSKIPKLKAEGKIRILEIGIGPGFNLQFYPANCNLIGLDYNPSFEKVVRDNMKLFPEMTLEDFIIGSATGMENIPCESVDVVVSTLVFCSISDIRAALQEVHRVLTPGGRFYYMEHILEEPKTFMYTLQTLLNKFYIWPFLYDGCHFKALDNMLGEGTKLFPSVEQKKFSIDTSGWWVFEFVRTYVAGIKIK